MSDHSRYATGKSQEILKIINEGKMTFNEAAREFSIDKAGRSGLLGWKRRTELDQVSCCGCASSSPAQIARIRERDYECRIAHPGCLTSPCNPINAYDTSHSGLISSSQERSFFVKRVSTRDTVVFGLTRRLLFCPTVGLLGGSFESQSGRIHRGACENAVWLSHHHGASS